MIIDRSKYLIELGKRKGKVYYQYQIGHPNRHAYCQYKPEYPQQGIVEITAINDMGR